MIRNASNISDFNSAVHLCDGPALFYFFYGLAQECGRLASTTTLQFSGESSYLPGLFFISGKNAWE
jgi:hypothetical protein